MAKRGRGTKNPAELQPNFKVITHPPNESPYAFIVRFSSATLPEKKIERAEYSQPAPEATAKAENLTPNNEIQSETLMPETLNAAGAFGGGDRDG